jgi:hypothetical protein
MTAISTTKDFRVTVKVRNNLLLSRMESLGIPTMSALARVAGVHPTEVHEVAAMRTGFIKPNGQWRKAVRKIADALCCRPEDIIPEAARSEPMKQREASFTMNAEDGRALGLSLRNLALPPSADRDRRETEELVEMLLESLSPRERRVLRSRFGFDEEKTLGELGAEFGLTGERVRLIEGEALNRLGRPTMAKLINKLSGTNSHRELLGSLSD